MIDPVLSVLSKDSESIMSVCSHKVIHAVSCSLLLSCLNSTVALEYMFEFVPVVWLENCIQPIEFWPWLPLYLTPWPFPKIRTFLVCYGFCVDVPGNNSFMNIIIIVCIALPVDSPACTIYHIGGNFRLEKILDICIIYGECTWAYDLSGS